MPRIVEINRATHINRSVTDLEKRVEMAVIMAQELGTCYYRCGASNALTHLASVTWDRIKDLNIISINFNLSRRLGQFFSFEVKIPNKYYIIP